MRNERRKSDEKTKKTDFVNFIITAENAEGLWSDPHVLEGAPGIDPDIFFDDDGKVWYTGTHSPQNPDFEGQGEIWLQELDLDQEKLVGPRKQLTHGHANNAVWAEGPHLYKINGKYVDVSAIPGATTERLAAFRDRVSIRTGNFRYAAEMLTEYIDVGLDGALLDLGVS